MKLIDEKIIDDLFESLGLRFLAQKEQSEIMTRVLELISKRAGLKIVEKFSNQETEKFNKIPADDLAQMENFMIAKNANAKKIFQEEAEMVKEEILRENIS